MDKSIVGTQLHFYRSKGVITRPAVDAAMHDVAGTTEYRYGAARLSLAPTPPVPPQSRLPGSTSPCHCSWAKRVVVVESRLHKLDDNNVLCSFPTAARAMRVKTLLCGAIERGQALPFLVRWWGVGVDAEMEPATSSSSSTVYSMSARVARAPPAVPSAGGGSGWSTVVKGGRADVTGAPSAPSTATDVKPTFSDAFADDE